MRRTAFLASVATTAALCGCYVTNPAADAAVQRPSVQIVTDGGVPLVGPTSYNRTRVFGLKFANPGKSDIDAKGKLTATGGLILGSCGVRVPANGSATCFVEASNLLWTPGLRTLSFTAANAGGRTSLAFPTTRVTVSVPTVANAVAQPKILGTNTLKAEARKPFTYTIAIKTSVDSAPFKPVLKSTRLGRTIDAICVAGCRNGVVVPGTTSNWRVTFVPTAAEIASGSASVDLAIAANAREIGNPTRHAVIFPPSGSSAAVQKLLNSVPPNGIGVSHPDFDQYTKLLYWQTASEYFDNASNVQVNSTSADGRVITGTADVRYGAEIFGAFPNPQWGTPSTGPPNFMGQVLSTSP